MSRGRGDVYKRQSLRYMSKIIDGIKRDYDGKIIPVTLFTKGGGAWLEQIAATGCDAVGIDWTVQIGEAESRVGSKVALQGNLDPSVLLASPEVIKTEAYKILDQFHGSTGHVFNLGHGITPEVNPEKMKVLVDVVHSYSK